MMQYFILRYYSLLKMLYFKVCFSLSIGVSSISDSVGSRCSADLFREEQECCDIKRFSAGADPGPGNDAAGFTLITARPLSDSAGSGPDEGDL